LDSPQLAIKIFGNNVDAAIWAISTRPVVPKPDIPELM
jgi:hypothetical protein